MNPSDLQTDLAVLAKRSQIFVEYFNKNDAKALTTLYTSDAELLAPGVPRLTGLAAIESFWRTAFSRGKRNFDQIEPISTIVNGNLAVEYANWHLSVVGPDGKVTKDTGKNVLVWKRIGQEWLIGLDIWNTP